MAYPNIKWFIRIFAVVFIIYSLYIAGLAPEYIILFVLITSAFWILRGHLYRKIDSFIKKIFPWTKKMPSWVEKGIIIISFIIVYIILKDLVFLILKLFGLDFDKALTAITSKNA